MADLNAAMARFERRPLVSIIMPVFNPNLSWLIKAVESVQRQIYPDWELCIADDASQSDEVKQYLTALAAADARVKVVFRPQNGHISAASNSAIELSSGQWLALMDNDDVLSAQALFWVVKAINDHPQAKMIYSDEDKITEKGKRYAPYFKCDWNMDLFYGHNMFSHLGVYEAELVKGLGGFREGFEGAQDHLCPCGSAGGGQRIGRTRDLGVHGVFGGAGPCTGAGGPPPVQLFGAEQPRRHTGPRGILGADE
jgi:hypothetical protein